MAYPRRYGKAGEASAAPSPRPQPFIITLLLSAAMNSPTPGASEKWQHSRLVLLPLADFS